MANPLIERYKVDDPAYNTIFESAGDIATGPLACTDVRAAFETYASEPEHSLDELLLDGMHPNDKGHAIIADLLLPAIRDQVR